MSKPEYGFPAGTPDATGGPNQPLNMSQAPVDTSMPPAGYSPSLMQGRPDALPMPSQPPPPISGPTESRLNAWRGLLTDFVWSLGEGMTQRATLRTHGAGIGAALTGTFSLEAQRQKQAQEAELQRLRQAQEERTQVAAQEAMNKIYASQTELPAKLQEILARTGQIKSTTDVNNARIPQIGAQIANTTASTQNLLAEAASKQFIKVGEKLYQVKDLVAGGNVHALVDATDDVTMTVTKELADGVGQPELAGHTVTGKTAKELIGMYSTATKTTPTANGVLRDNLITGDRENLGPPPAVAAAGERPVNVIGEGGVPKVVSAATAIKEGMTPGNLGDANKLTGQEASFANFHSNADQVKALLPAIDKPGATTRIAAALAQPASTVGQYVQGQLATGQLTPDEYNLINALATFKEDIFNLRQFFGNSPIRSNQQVALMMQQVPSIADLATGNSAQVKAKIENFERSVGAVEKQYGPLLSILHKTPTAAAAPTNPNTPVPDFIVQPGGRMVPNPAKGKR